MTALTDAQAEVFKTPTEEDILASIQAVFPDDVISDWDAFIGNIYHKDDPNRRIGGFLVIRAFGVGQDGSVERQIDIDDNHRPFDEESITVIGARALFNAEGIREAAIVVRDGRKYSKQITRILC